MHPEQLSARPRANMRKPLNAGRAGADVGSVGVVRSIICAGLALLCVPATAAAAPTYSSVPTANGAFPVDVAATPDGNVWYTDDSGKSIGRIAPGGTVTQYGNVHDKPSGITPGAGNEVWFVESTGEGRVGRVDAAGTLSEWRPTTNQAAPTSIVLGPDGNFWFTERAKSSAIGRITPTGTITEFRAGLTIDSTPWGIAAGPDGNLWFTEKAGRIGRITPQGVITEFSAGLSAGAVPTQIAAGPDGNLWFTSNGPTPRIGRISPQGVITEFPTGLSAGVVLDDITAGRDGNLWFSEQGTPYVGQITPTGTISEYAFASGKTPSGISSGPDGNLLIAEHGAEAIGKVTVAPGVGTATSSSVTSSDAQLAVEVRPNSQATTYSFEYGTAAAPHSSST